MPPLWEATLIHESGRKGLSGGGDLGHVRPGNGDFPDSPPATGCRAPKPRRGSARKWTPTEKPELSDYVIDNSGDIESTRRQVVALAGVLLEKGVT